MPKGRSPQGVRFMRVEEAFWGEPPHTSRPSPRCWSTGPMPAHAISLPPVQLSAQGLCGSALSRGGGEHTTIS